MKVWLVDVLQGDDNWCQLCSVNNKAKTANPLLFRKKETAESIVAAINSDDDDADEPIARIIAAEAEREQ